MLAKVTDESLVAAEVLLPHCQQLVILTPNPGHLLRWHERVISEDDQVAVHVRLFIVTGVDSVEGHFIKKQ